MLLFFIGCTNPFAPTFDESVGDDKPPISDQKDINGVFQNFQYAYTFKDTTIYGQLLTQDFVFTYRDYDQGFDVSWGRDDEMRTTLGLFQNVQRLDLIWNNIILLTQDSLTANVVRSFNLTIIFNPTDVIRVDGRVNLALKKNPENEKWQISRWLDESNF
ncbi:hypothetical protein [Ignavibacterium album]|uniref:hypothetical protein n=1 Tax=Ignavibacterium album TaxID=591197 RepID=UPI0026EC2602|nr:hypothetical protein [Ignavibacterium album]